MNEESNCLPETVEGNSSLQPLSSRDLTLAEFIMRLGRLERFITTGEEDAAFGCGTKINSCPSLECVTHTGRETKLTT